MSPALDVETAIAVLQDGLNRCRREDMRTSEVFAALDFLGSRATNDGHPINFRSH
jgi:hypothetical protein